MQRIVRATVAALFATLLAGAANAKEYLLTSVKPNTLVLVDPAERRVTRTYDIAGPGSVLGIAPSPDGRIAYVVTNRWNSLVGIDLDSGAEVFHADFSAGALRVRNTFGLEISHDGREIFVLLLPTVIGPSEYHVQDPTIAVYRADAGLHAVPARTLPVPRRTAQLMLSDDGAKLYCVSWDIHAIDPQDGHELGVQKLIHWDRPGFAEPDVFGVWTQFEQSHIWINPYAAARTDVDPADPAAMRTGMATLDLATGAFRMIEFENTTKVIFSAVVNPVQRNEAFAVYTTLSKVDLAKGELVRRVDLPHTYYTVNISADGREVYVGGTMDDIGVYAADTLARIGEIRMPGGADQATSWVRIVQR